MSKALIKTGSKTRGIIPAVASAIIPGVGQMVNGQFEKGVGVLVVYAVAGASMIKWIPVIGAVGWAIAGAAAIVVALLALLLARALRGSSRAPLADLAIAACLWATAFGALEEILQLSVPARSADVADVVANAVDDDVRHS